MMPETFDVRKQILEEEVEDVFNANDDEVTRRGKPFTCRICKYKFKLFDEERDHFLSHKEPCPSCGTRFCTKFKTERDLLEWQDLYYDSGKDPKYIELMYGHLFPYAKSLILKGFSNVVNDPEEIDYHAHSSATFLIEEFLKERKKKSIDNYRQFYIFHSFGGILILKIKLSIFGKHEHMIDAASIDMTNEDDKQIIQIEDTKIRFVQEVINREDAILTLDYLEKLIKGVSRYCSNSFENTMRLLALRNYLMKGENAANKVFQRYDRVGKDKFMKTLEMIKSQLKGDSK